MVETFLIHFLPMGPVHEMMKLAKEAAAWFFHVSVLGIHLSSIEIIPFDSTPKYEILLTGKFEHIFRAIQGTCLVITL